MIELKCSVTTDTIIKNIPAECSQIHLVRPLNEDRILEILKRCRQLEKITLSKSCLKRLPEKSRKILKQKGISMEIDSRKGRSIELDFATINKIIELAKDEQSFREIEKVTGVPKSTVHYLIKYADRGKIRNGKNILYLK